MEPLCIPQCNPHIDPQLPVRRYSSKALSTPNQKLIACDAVPHETSLATAWTASIHKSAFE